MCGSLMTIPEEPLFNQEPLGRSLITLDVFPSYDSYTVDKELLIVVMDSR